MRFQAPLEFVLDEEADAMRVMEPGYLDRRQESGKKIKAVYIPRVKSLASVGKSIPDSLKSA